MRRSLTRAGVRRLSSPSLVSPSAMRSYTATRRTSFPSRNNPRPSYHLQHHHLLLPRHPKLRKRKRKSSDMSLLGNRARRGAVSGLSRISSPANTSRNRERGRRSREGVVGVASGLYSLSGASSRCYWRAGRSGSEDGALRPWTPMFIIPVSMARRTRITPEEVERAIGAAFAIGTAV